MLSVVIPVYKNEGSIPELLEQLRGVAARLDAPLEVVFAIDGSPDRCAEILRAELPKQPFASQIVLHARNFGSFAAIRSGLAAGRGDHFAVIAADLQEPPSLLVDFHTTLVGGGADIAVGQRTSREDPIVSKLFSAVFWWLYRRFVQPEVPAGGVDLFGCTRQVRDEILRLEESNSSLVGLLFWVGFRRAYVPYGRMARRHGKSAWTFSRKLRYLMDSVYAFSDLPLRLLTWIGGAALFAAVTAGIIVLTARLVGKIEVPGYTPIVLITTFFGGLNAAGLGIIGGYVWRAFENTKRRPSAVVRTTLQFSPAEAEKEGT